MSTGSIGFIGGGRITRIFLEGWKRQGKLPEHITVSDCNAANLKMLKTQFPGITTVADGNPLAAACEILFLAVHPPAMATVTADVKGSVKPEAIVVSLAPKFSIAQLTELLGGFARIARMIPNAPSIIGAGYNPISFSPALSSSERTELSQLFTPLGDCLETPESKLEGYAILTAMGPTYFWFQLETLRKISRDRGLIDTEITPALGRMISGATRTLFDSGLSPDEVMDLIPVKPLAEDEHSIELIYESRLSALYSKIKS